MKDVISTPKKPPEIQASLDGDRSGEMSCPVRPCQVMKMGGLSPTLTPSNFEMSADMFGESYFQSTPSHKAGSPDRCSFAITITLRAL